MLFSIVIFDNLKLFRDIAQTKSISRGATLNGISQSAASQYMQEMERRLGVTLLDRTTRPLALTPAGKLFYDLCRDVLRREEQFQVQLENLKGLVEGTVRVASIYSVGLSEMSRLQEEFAARFPECAASCGLSAAGQSLRSGAGRSGRSRPGELSGGDEGSGGDSVARRRDDRGRAAFASAGRGSRCWCRPISMARTSSASTRISSIRRELDRFFREQGIEIRMAMQFDNIQMIKEAVALGSGISILPARTMQAEIAQGRLVSIPLHAPGTGAAGGHRAPQAQALQPRGAIVSGIAAGAARAGCPLSSCLH